MLGWWYSAGWQWLISRFIGNLRAVGEIFSVGILLKTWFAPWKQIQSPSSFQNFLRNAVDNLISRFIGATVRTGMLFAAFFLTVITIVLGIIAVVVWPIVPLLVVALPFLAVTKAGL